MKGRPKAELVLNEMERERLSVWTRRRKTASLSATVADYPGVRQRRCEQNAVHREVRNIVGLYLDPPDRALVLCVDQESQIQALDCTQPVLR